MHVYLCAVITGNDAGVMLGTNACLLVCRDNRKKQIYRFL